MNRCREKYIDVQGFRLGLKIWGPDDGHPVLALHGMLDNAASYDLLAPYLSEFHLVAVDSPGTGRSSHYPPGILPYWKNDAFIILELLEALSWERFDIIGHSLGTILATVIATVIPERVRKLVFLDALGPLVSFQENHTKYLHQAALSYREYSTISPTSFPSKEAAIHDRMGDHRISYSASQALVERGTEEGPSGVVWTFDRRLRCDRSSFPFNDRVIAMLCAIEAPVCLIRASNGLRYPPEVYAARVAAVNHLEQHWLSGGHHVHMDDPTAVAQVIQDFLL